MMMQTYHGSEPNQSMINNRPVRKRRAKETTARPKRTARVCAVSFWLALVWMVNISVISAVLLGKQLTLLMEKRGGKFHLFLSGTLTSRLHSSQISLFHHWLQARIPTHESVQGGHYKQSTGPKTVPPVVAQIVWISEIASAFARRAPRMQLRQSDVITSPDDITGWHHQRRRAWSAGRGVTTLQDTRKERSGVKMQVSAGHVT